MYTDIRNKGEGKIAKRKTLLVFLIPFAIAVLVQLVVVNTAPGSGGQLAQIERETINVQREANVLKAEIAGASALQKLSKDAETLGLVKPSTVLYMDTTTQDVADNSQRTNLIGNAGQ